MEVLLPINIIAELLSKSLTGTTEHRHVLATAIEDFMNANECGDLMSKQIMRVNGEWLVDSVRCTPRERLMINYMSTRLNATVFTSCTVTRSTSLVITPTSDVTMSSTGATISLGNVTRPTAYFINGVGTVRVLVDNLNSSLTLNVAGAASVEVIVNQNVSGQLKIVSDTETEGLVSADVVVQGHANSNSSVSKNISGKSTVQINGDDKALKNITAGTDVSNSSTRYIVTVNSNVNGQGVINVSSRRDSKVNISVKGNHNGAIIVNGITATASLMPVCIMPDIIAYETIKFSDMIARLDCYESEDEVIENTQIIRDVIEEIAVSKIMTLMIRATCNRRCTIISRSQILYMALSTYFNMLNVSSYPELYDLVIQKLKLIPQCKINVNSMRITLTYIASTRIIDCSMREIISDIISILQGK